MNDMRDLFVESVIKCLIMQYKSAKRIRDLAGGLRRATMCWAFAAEHVQPDEEECSKLLSGTDFLPY